VQQQHQTPQHTAMLVTAQSKGDIDNPAGAAVRGQTWAHRPPAALNYTTPP
jgi:hypothetical protein